jgi:hypothetical protein
MSVPLDRLYNFLDSINRHNGHDAIIYRFSPHGSRKPEDLTPLYKLRPWREQMTTPFAFYHDQEPLNFDYYSKQDFLSMFNNPTLKYEVTFEEVIQFKLVDSVIKYNVYDHAIICHSEKNSKNLLLYEKSEFTGVYWWSHAIIARDWFRHAEHDLDLTVNFDKITHDFLIYSRAWSGTREYRLTLAEMLVDQNLINSCRTSFAPTDTDCYYTNHVFVNSSLKIKRTDLESIYHLNTANSTDSADYNNCDYGASGIELVLETLFDDDRLHLTEKSLRPIACGRPFMLAATPGSLDYLRSYGFETFSGLINESYDLEPDPHQRLQHITTEMKRISSLDKESKQQLWKKLYEIAERNKKRFFSISFHDDIVQEYSDNFDSAMKFTKHHRTGKRWKQLLKASESDPALALRLSQYQPGINRTAADVEFVNACLANPPN